MTLTILQITAIGILTHVAFMHGENGLCHWLTTSSLVWGGKLALFQLYPDIWFMRKRLKTRAEPVQGVPVVRVCPPDHATFMNLLTFIDALLVAIWILLQVGVLVVHGKQCYAHAPLVSTLAVVLLALALLYYLPTTLLLIFRRSRESRSDGGDNIEIGPLPQSKVDRIDLVYYIPPPAPAPALAARPSGPVAGLRRFGPTSRGLSATSDDNNNGEWEKSFQRMPRAFLRIEKHEAQCAICLDEYTAPPRVTGEEEGAIPGSATSASAAADAQGVPEPLRWLDCGHVFHKRCIDPYITTKAAKCPTCRAPVKVQSKGRK
ncbi:hypothetical protein GSI_14278 [Ganoderma sinense ZZ0214-1]|uniref:RING-type domain-containing protein n=1 Tax=Ganoderma sinense ZZ0214-1 TaxID=1077348 RepID=A0A2G8RSN3_9APHY|nr:hypothetical protein GSI_14278 [Ganoderma sinense ZZ0214-1]